jgi:tRNA pseudouridine55 synthase
MFSTSTEPSCSESPADYHGILLVDKPQEITSFRAVSRLRHVTKERTIGHAGTLDPFASGLLVLLIGRTYTRMSNTFLNCDKAYLATLELGRATDSYDRDGTTTNTSDHIPTLEEVQHALNRFQGKSLQIPPMFSAKKINGKKLYELARAGKEVERAPVEVTMEIELLSYQYPYLELAVTCSKGTYIRSLAHDLAIALGTYGHLRELRRTRSGPFNVQDAIPFDQITPETREQLRSLLITHIDPLPEHDAL